MELDLNEIVARVEDLAGREDPEVRLVDVVPLEGGVSSLTFRAALRSPEGTRPIVLKVAPPGLAPVRNRDVLRQARVIDALAGLDGFPVPRVLLTQDGTPPWFAMEFRPGDSYEPLLDVTARPPTPEVVHARFLVAARALARMQAASTSSLGLRDEPVGTPGDELERWHRLFETVDEDLQHGQRALHERLAARVPSAVAPSLLHGDYRCANMLFVGPELEAVIDWEIWSVGDPRADLAWLLMHTDPPQVFNETRPAGDVAAGEGVPDRETVLAEYVRVRRALGASEDDIAGLTADLAWFLAVCIYKTASTIAVIVKRERKREHPSERMMIAARHLAGIVAAGHAVLDRDPFTTV